MGRKPIPKDQKRSHYHITLLPEAAKVLDKVPVKEKSAFISNAVVKYAQLEVDSAK